MGTSHRLTINGAAYQVFDDGDSDRAVLLLHGMPDASAVWRHQVEPLVAAGHRVIRPDLLGYGESDKPADPARYAGELLVADVVALIGALEIERLDLVGHDWGAFLSWELAIAAPELVRRHVAISVGHPGVMLSDFSPRSLRQNWYMYLNAQDDAADLYAQDDCSFLLNSLMPTHPDPEEVRARLRSPEAMRGMLNWDRGNQLATYFLAFARGEAVIEKCAVPTLGIWSSGDDYLLEEHVQASERFMTATWRYARIEGGSHWPMLDRADDVSRLLVDWLAEL